MGRRHCSPAPGVADELMMAFEGEEETGDAPADALATLAPAPEALLARAMTELRSILTGPTIQARCLECPPVAAAPVLRNDDRNWLARLLSWA